MFAKPTYEALESRCRQAEERLRKMCSERCETAAEEREVVIALFRLLSQPGELHQLMADVTRLMQHWSGCEAVGIRLRQSEDFPYFETRGFPPEFVQAENHLCARDERGEMIRDWQGNPVLECMCGNVLCGRFDPNLPFFTANGSFWTNSTTQLLATSTQEDRQTKTRNQCHGEGFESVALIPLRDGQETFGLLQFNDSRKDRFFPARIELLERLASSVAVAIREHRNTEALRESQLQRDRFSQMLASILEHTHMMAVYLDPRFNFIWVNPAYAATCGHAPAFFTGKNHFHLYPHPENQAIFQKVVDTGKPYFVAAKPFVFPDQSERGVTYWDWSLIPVTEAAGKVLGLVFTLIEVTDRVRDRQALQEQKDLLAAIRQAQGLFISRRDPGQIYRALLDILVQHSKSEFGFLDEVLHEPDGTPYKLNLAVSNIAWNDKSRRIYQELVERRLEFRDLSNLSGAPILEGRTIIANNVSEHPRYRGLPKGHPALISYMGIPLYWKHQIIGVAGVANRQGGYDEEIAELIKPLTQTCAAMIWAGRILRHDQETREHLELLFDINPDAVQITRVSDGGVVNINKGFTTMTGYTPRDIIGKTPLQIDLWENPDQRRHVLDEIEKEGYCNNYEAAFRRKDGSLLVGLMSSRLFSYQGKPHLLTVTRDITDKKKMEEQVRHLHKADSLGRMAGAIAHIFNNQLNVIMGNLQLAMDDLPGDSATQEFLTEAMQATKRSSEISGRMLTYLGRSFGTRERLDLSEVCRKTLPMLRHAIPKSIVVETDLMTGGPVVNCNFSQIQQVVINLVTNAIEAIGEQTGKITLATKTAPSRNVAKSHSAPADWQPKTDTLACLEVTDTGCGMPAEDLDKLFDPFFTTKFIGRGLGLPVVFGIVKAFDGVISVESRQGPGSTFRVYLPLVTDADAVLAPEDAAWSRGGQERRHGAAGG